VKRQIVSEPLYPQGHRAGIMTLTFAIQRAPERIPPIHERAQPPPEAADHVGGRRSIPYHDAQREPAC
jgi:hypothetical protein